LANDFTPQPDGCHPYSCVWEKSQGWRLWHPSLEEADAAGTPRLTFWLRENGADHPETGRLTQVRTAGEIRKVRNLGQIIRSLKLLPP
jgi:hypothetical protein